jgi:hypothetical protein
MALTRLRGVAGLWGGHFGEAVGLIDERQGTATASHDRLSMGKPGSFCVLARMTSEVSGRMMDENLTTSGRAGSGLASVLERSAWMVRRGR